MDDSTVPTPDAARHQWLLTKYSIPDMGDHTRAGGYLSQILERLATTRVLSVEDKQFLRDKGLFDLSDFVGKLEETGGEDFSILRARAEREGGRSRRRALFRKYGMDWIEPADLRRVASILEAAERGSRISEDDVVWLTTHDYFSPALKRAFHRQEAMFHAQAFKDGQDPWHAVNASSHYRKADMAPQALSLLSMVDIESQSNSHLKAALLTTKGGASRDASLRDEAMALAERAHAVDPRSFHPCTLMGALKYELGDYASGDIWFAKAVERGASSSSIDHELRSILRSAGNEAKERLKRHLLQVDPDRFGWVRATKKSK